MNNPVSQLYKKVFFRNKIYHSEEELRHSEKKLRKSATSIVERVYYGGP